MVIFHLRLKNFAFSQLKRRDELLVVQVMEDLKFLLLVHLALRIEELAPLRNDTFFDLVLEEQRVVRRPDALRLYHAAQLL